MSLNNYYSDSNTQHIDHLQTSPQPNGSFGLENSDKIVRGDPKNVVSQIQEQNYY